MGKKLLLLILSPIAGAFILFGTIMLLVFSAALNAPHAYMAIGGLVWGAVALFFGGSSAWVLWQYARHDDKDE